MRAWLSLYHERVAERPYSLRHALYVEIVDEETGMVLGAFPNDADHEAKIDALGGLPAPKEGALDEISKGIGGALGNLASLGRRLGEGNPVTPSEAEQVAERIEKPETP